jgi:hypothetical protein
MRRIRHYVLKITTERRAGNQGTLFPSSSGYLPNVKPIKNSA